MKAKHLILQFHYAVHYYHILLGILLMVGSDVTRYHTDVCPCLRVRFPHVAKVLE